MKTVRKSLILALILTAFLSSVAASPAELTVFPEKSSTEINSFTSYEVLIENTGPVADVYHMSSSSSSEVTIAPKRVPRNTDEVLEPGEAKVVNVWFNPNSKRDAGEYSFKITARSQSTDKRYSTDAKVEIIKDHQVDVQVADSKTGCLGQNVVYEVNVTNNGIQKESFKLTARFGELSQKQLTLEPGESRQVKLTASAKKPKQKTFNVIAASKSSYAQDIESVEFKSEKCYASDVSITPGQQDTAAFTEAEFDVTVRNTGTKSDEFVLSTNLGEFEDNKLEIDGGSSETTTLSVKPENLGEQRIKVKAKSRVTSSDSAVMKVTNGMEAEVGFEEGTKKVCETESFEVTATVENTGEATETYSLETTRGNLTESELELDPGESDEVEIEMASRKLGVGKHEVNLTATAETFGEPVKTASKTVRVENCWDLSMNVVPQVMSAGENRSVIYEIRLQNNGTRQNTYKLSKQGPEWISIKPSELTIKAGETDTAFMYAGIPFKKKGEVDITAVAEGKEVRRSQEVKLLIGKEVKDAVKSDKKKAPTGGFSDRLPSGKVDLGSNLGKLAASLVIGLLITAGVLYHEW